MHGRNSLSPVAYNYHLDQPDIWDHLPLHTSVRLLIHSHVVTEEPPTGPHRLRGILISRFFLNLRHVFFKKDGSSSGTISSLRIRIPTITSEDFVGNLGAPLRSSLTSGQYPLASPGPSSRRKSCVGADPLLDRCAGELEEEDLDDDVEITSRRPILVGLGIDPNLVGEGSGRPLWRKEFDGIGVEGEEVILLVDRKGKDRARSPVRSESSPPVGEDDGELVPPGRQLLKSAVDEADALLVDANGYVEDSYGYSRESTEDLHYVGGGSETQAGLSQHRTSRGSSGLYRLSV